MNANDNIALIEDHHEALGIWREKKVRNLDLVHIDAHLDFGFHAARPIMKNRPRESLSGLSDVR